MKNKLLRNLLFVVVGIAAAYQVMRTTGRIRTNSIRDALVKANPPCTVYTLEGDTADIRTLGGGMPAMIVYFSPDCSHCQDEAHRLERRLADFTNVRLIMLSAGGKEATLAFARDYRLDQRPGVRFYLDSRHQFWGTFGIRAYPIILLYDREGRLTDLFKGAASPDKLLRALEKG